MEKVTVVFESGNTVKILLRECRGWVIMRAELVLSSFM